MSAVGGLKVGVSGVKQGHLILFTYTIISSATQQRPGTLLVAVFCVQQLKYETEVKQKISMDLLRELGPNLGTIRAPGIGLLYNELAKGIPAIFGHFLTTLPAVHSMIIFVCIKYVPVPVVPQNERFLFRRDARKENHHAFEQLLIESLEKFIRREAQERSLESDGDGSDSEEEYSFSRVLVAPNGSAYSLGVPLLSDFRDTGKAVMEKHFRRAKTLDVF
ncbi:hypothetical protein RND71_000459 [Anisodus tanguticus]|uniref:K+ potassium transporter C-terminal domain-containing protein n=1 Tax=Anisodus tanguticus TaxID=243964 RepID=A0AAE1SYU4_9SOLA|nr:hypothetical protein RND71_000459 [Anisodus tanguticus]